MTRSIRSALIASALAFAAALPAAADPQEDADALLAAQSWAEAATAYEALLADDSSVAGNWYSLASARHNLEDYAGARDAYLRAIDAGVTPLPRTRYHLARALMALGDAEGALVQLEEIAKTGGPNFRVLEQTAEFAPLAEEARFRTVLDALRPCEAAEARQFDFWLGSWTVSAGGPQPIATSHITSAQDGCVVIEDYAAGGFTGMSINFYDPQTEKWHQTWMSNARSAVYLEGGLDETGAMVMTDADLPISTITGVINKVTWSPLEDGGVRQHWQTSSDSGETWTTTFDGHYARAADDGTEG